MEKEKEKENEIRNEISVLNHLVGLGVKKSLYNPYLATYFKWTTKFSLEASKSQLAWLELKKDRWIKEVGENTDVRILGLNFNEPNHSTKEVRLVAELVVCGGLRKSIDLNSHEVIQILNEVSKGLAIGIEQNFPFLKSGEEIMFAPKTPIRFYLEKPKPHHWCIEDLSLFDEDSPKREELSRFFSSYDATLTDVEGLTHVKYKSDTASLYHRMFNVE